MNDRLLYPFVIFALLSSAFITAYNGSSMMSIVFTIGRDLQFSLNEVEWSVIASVMITSASILIAGQLGDTIDHTVCVLIGNLIFLIGSLMLALTYTSWLAIFGRCLQGLATGILIPTSLTALKQTLSSRQAYATGLWSGFTGLGFAAGPIIGGALIYITWRWVFWLDTIILGISIIALYLYIRTKPKIFTYNKQRLDLPCAVLWAVFLILLTILVLQGQSWGWQSSIIISFYILTPIAFIAFLYQNHCSQKPLLDLQLFKVKEYLVANIVMFSAFFILYGLIYGYNISFQEGIAIAHNPLHIGLELLPLTLMVFCLPILVEYHLPQALKTWLMRIGLLFLLAGSAALTWANTNHDYKNLWWQLWLTGIGVGITFPVILQNTFLLTPDKDIGNVSGTLNTFNFIGSTFGVVFFHLWFLNAYSTQFQALIKHLTGITVRKNTILHTLATDKQHYISRFFPSFLEHKAYTFQSAFYINSFHEACTVFVIIAALATLTTWAVYWKLPLKEKA